MIDFGALQSAVKPKDRTDKYVVLSAMFHLKAHVSPVTSKQVSALLKLRLGKKAPTNVPDCLRKYSNYVQPVEQGPPLLWALTPNGIDHLRSLSGLALSEPSDDQNFLNDVGIICALEYPELAAVLRALGGPTAWREIGSARYAHVYRETRLRTKGGKDLRVVATTSTSMGLTAAAIATTQLVLQFRPRMVAMVGIAAGTRSSNKQFGDVLVADPSVDYNSGKVAASGGIREFLPDPYPIGLHPRLRSVLHKYRGSNATFAEIRKRWKGAAPEETNHLHLGPLGAADQVIDDASRVIEIQKNWRKLIGVEMETYGVYRACHESPDPKPRFVSFKAVCDFAAEKTDSWQEYAAFVAAEFAVEFFRLEWESLWPTP
jgi:nucleoside phosphorylase